MEKPHSKSPGETVVSGPADMPCRSLFCAALFLTRRSSPPTLGLKKVLRDSYLKKTGGRFAGGPEGKIGRYHPL
jgi:hypothetical protein